MTLAVSMVPPSLLAQGPRPRTALDQITFDHFASQLNTAFTVQQGSGAAGALHLIQARLHSPANSPAAADAANEKFSLVFSGAASQPLSQDTYSFVHPALGRFEMFISQVGPTAKEGQSFYEAIFNRPPEHSRPASTRQAERPARARNAR
ncbi:MAG TPA: hypothetical protein VN794_10465 [Methylomirabilota bacterium]|nr:hypothetical protein [Methylomirabilota bacterium]